jgi:taurine dioxygenase
MAERKLYHGKAEQARNLSNSRAAADYSSIAVTPVTPVIGVEVTGVDLTAPLPSAQAADLARALANHNVLFFRDQRELTPEQHIAFGRNFGDLHVHPASPHMAGRPEIMEIDIGADSVVNNGSDWHSDVSSDDEPPLGTILQVHKTPTSGGDTLFANMYAAYDALSEVFKRRLERLTAVHDPERAFRGRYADRGKDDTGRVFSAAEHPVVRTHPVSGRQALFVNETFTTRIVGMTPEESDTILNFLFRHLTQPRFQVRFHWRPNDIAFWDNRCTQHMALWDYWPEPRRGRRVTVKGDRPFYRGT